MENEDILQAALKATSSLLPNKSKAKYEKCYELFGKWRINKKVEEIDENVMLAYLYEKAKTIKSSTLWSTYSMLKSTIQMQENVDISKYSKLYAFLKRQNDGYVAKKSNILTMENIATFLREAPNDSFLMMKVVLIFGLNGACRREELRKLTVDDIENTGSILVVTLHDTKTSKKRIFTVTSKMANINAIELYKKYSSLRPKHVDHKRFFLYYKNGKCSVQPVGINTFATMPRKIAEYLHLPNSSSYTGHCFRRSSATLLADSGADIQILKKHGGWRSTSVAESYVEDSIKNKIKTSTLISGQKEGDTPAFANFQQHSSPNEDNLLIPPPINMQTNEIVNIPSTSGCNYSFSNVHNCTINIYNAIPNQ